jgi:hypothetical protein
MSSRRIRALAGGRGAKQLKIERARFLLVSPDIQYLYPDWVTSEEIGRRSGQVEGLSWQEKAVDEDRPKESRGGKEGAKGGRIDGRWRRSTIN